MPANDNSALFAHAEEVFKRSVDVVGEFEKAWMDGEPALSGEKALVRQLVEANNYLYVILRAAKGLPPTQDDGVVEQAFPDRTSMKPEAWFNVLSGLTNLVTTGQLLPHTRAELRKILNDFIEGSKP